MIETMRCGICNIREACAKIPAPNDALEMIAAGSIAGATFRQARGLGPQRRTGPIAVLVSQQSSTARPRIRLRRLGVQSKNLRLRPALPRRTPGPLPEGPR